MLNLRNLDLNLLKAFDALMDERSVTKAAQRLAITQPAMSGTLLRLRESFDDPLFIRVQRGIEPTNYAKTLAEPIKAILNEIEELLKPKIFDPRTAELTVSIACTDYALRAVISPFLVALKQQAPRIKLALYMINNDLIQEQLAKGIIDFALVTPEFSPPDVYSQTLFDEEYVCIVSKSNPLAKENHISLEAFCQYEQALISHNGGAFSGATDQALADIGKVRNVVLSVQNFLILPEYLELTEMIAVVPKRLVIHQPQIKIFTPPVAIQGFTKVLAWHKRTHYDKAYQWIRELIAHSVKAE